MCNEQTNQQTDFANQLITKQAAIDALDIGCELLRRALDDTDVVGVERAKYEWGLGLIESYIADIKELPSAQPQWIPVTKEEMFKAGYEGREIRFRVDGRLFAIRELAQ